MGLPASGTGIAPRSATGAGVGTAGVNDTSYDGAASGVTLGVTAGALTGAGICSNNQMSY